MDRGFANQCESHGAFHGPDLGGLLPGGQGSQYLVIRRGQVLHEYQALDSVRFLAFCQRRKMFAMLHDGGLERPGSKFDDDRWVVSRLKGRGLGSNTGSEASFNNIRQLRQGRDVLVGFSSGQTGFRTLS